MHELPNGWCPRIKICGVTRTADLAFIASAGADTVGINLIPTSRRYVDQRLALELALAAREQGLAVTAVMRNPTKELLHEVQSQQYWDFIQLHGDETPEIVSASLPISVIKAISLTGRVEEAELVESWTHWAGEVQPYETATTRRSPLRRLSCFLVDAYAPTEGGGTGRTADWSRLSPRPNQLKAWPILLAGGLVPGNVAAAIRMTGCDGVDSASGVEINPGIKSRELVEDFVIQANAGFAETI